MEADGTCGGSDAAAAALPKDPARGVRAECPHKRGDSRPAKEDGARKERDNGAAENSATDTQASGKLRLVRSVAVCEESPPACGAGDGPPESSEEPQARVASSLNVEGERQEEEEAAAATAVVAAAPGRVEAGDEKPGLEGKATKLLSRDSSQDYTDSTGIDVHEFLVNTLKSSPRDRIMLLKLEQELMDFIHDATQYKKFPQMTSYHRMLVHRVAAYFGMDHNVDQTGKAVVVNKTPSTRIPEEPFNHHFTEEGTSAEIAKRVLLKRDGDGVEPEDRQSSAPEYCLTEIRIQEPSPLSSTQKRRQMFRCHRDGSSGDGGGPGGSGSWQSSTETDYGGGTPPRRWGPRPWSSTDSESSHAAAASAASAPRRPAVIKASSFSGISTVLMRGDVCAPRASDGSPGNAGPASPCGAGASTACVTRTRHVQQQQQQQQQLRRSPAGCQPPPRASAAPSYCSSSSATATAATQVCPAGPSYCLLPLESMGIPPGSILVNPQTGQPFLNPDGSPAVYNPPPAQQPSRGQLSEPAQLILATAHHQHPDSHHHNRMTLSHGQRSSPASVQHPYAQHVMTFTPPEQYSMDDLGLQFGHVGLSHHSQGGEIPESTAAPYPPPTMHQSQHHMGYRMSPTPAQPVTPSGYGGATSSLPAAAQQQVYTLQQHQQQQPVPIFIYAQGQYGHVGQQLCRPMTPMQYGGSGGGQRGHHGHSSQTHGFQGPPQGQQQFQGVMGVHQAPPAAQLSSDGHAQLQSVLMQYPAASAAVPSYQIPYHLQTTSHSQHHHQQQHQAGTLTSSQHHVPPHQRGPTANTGGSDDVGGTVPVFCGPATASLGHATAARSPVGPLQACLAAVGPGGADTVPTYSAVSLPNGCRANYTALCMPWTQLKY